MGTFGVAAIEQCAMNGGVELLCPCSLADKAPWPLGEDVFDFVDDLEQIQVSLDRGLREPPLSLTSHKIEVSQFSADFCTFLDPPMQFFFGLHNGYLNKKPSGPGELTLSPQA